MDLNTMTSQEQTDKKILKEIDWYANKLQTSV